MNIIDIYSTPLCGFCKQIKALLKEHDIEFIEHDVTTSEEALKEMQSLTNGSMSVPVVVTNKGTDKQKYAIGFDESKLLLELGSDSKSTTPKEGEMAKLTCPKCGHKQEAPIPTTSCVPFYICDGCKETIQAEGEDCCVFCSHADKPCSISNTKGKGGCSDGACSV